MRTISYKCDRCGKPVTGRTVTRINATIQRGGDPAEKKSCDFCSACFLIIKRGFAQSLKMDEDTAEDLMPSAEPEVKTEPKIKIDPEVKKERARSKSLEPPHTKQSNEDRPITEEAVPEKPKTGTKESNAREAGLTLGPISKEERDEILRLFVEDGFDVDQIASRMNRLPRGIKRAINSANRSGELDRLKARFLEKQVEEKAAKKAAEEAIEEDLSEKNTGSGASNAGIVHDSYVSGPATEVINGKRYDVGGIMALHKAGWGAAMIADERHYDQDVVRVIIEKYS